MKKQIFILSLCICFLGFTNNARACTEDKCETESNVQDSNDGNKGYIFTYDCEKGAVSVGKWVDPLDIPELKGDKGDKGDPGIQGPKGDQGEQGLPGSDGIDGKDGLKGDKGDTGKQGDRGVDGQKGDKGEQGKDVDPTTVNNLQDQINKLDDPKYYLVPKVRLVDTKKWEITPYSKHNLNDSLRFEEAGVEVIFKFGESYEEKRINELEAKIQGLTQSSGEKSLVTYSYDSNGNVIGIHSKW